MFFPSLCIVWNQGNGIVERDDGIVESRCILDSLCCSCGVTMYIGVSVSRVVSHQQIVYFEVTFSCVFLTHEVLSGQIVHLLIWRDVTSSRIASEMAMDNKVCGTVMRYAMIAY